MLGAAGLPGRLGLNPSAVWGRDLPQSSQWGLTLISGPCMKCQLCKHLRHQLCPGSHDPGQILFVCPFGLAIGGSRHPRHAQRWAPRGMPGMLHLLLGGAKAGRMGARWMEMILHEANHSRHGKPSGAGAQLHLCSFCILATMVSPGRAQRSCCSCVRVLE